MKLIQTSVNRPVGVIIIVLAVMILGAVSLSGLVIDLLPDIDLPVAVVMTPYQGGSPQDVENLVTRPLEGTLSTVERLDSIQSISVSNQSVILLFFSFGTNMDNAMMDIRDRIEMVQGFMPEGADDSSTFRFDPNTLPIIQLSFSGDMDLNRLSAVAEQTIQPRLERLPGVAQVSLTGDLVREIQVQPDPAQLDHYGLTIGQLVQIIGAENASSSVGSVTRGSQDISLRVVGDVTSASQIENINIPLPTGDIVKLNEIAEVKDTFKEQASYAYVNGQRTLSIDITKQSDANTVNVADAVQAELKLLEAELPQGTEINTVMDASMFIKDSIDSVLKNMILGGTMAILVLLLFLRSFRSTLVIVLSIPIALISAFNLIYFSGETLNILTMGGLALGIGLMVDSSIVILENIFKYRERGYSRIESAIKGASEIGGAVIAATLTSVVVFAPIVFTDGIASQIFMPLALTVMFTLVASLVVSLTLVPMLSSRILPNSVATLSEGRSEETFSANNHTKKANVFQRIGHFIGRLLHRLEMIYKKALKWTLNHKAIIVFTTITLLVISLLLVPFVGVELLPAFDQGEILVEVELPPGTDIETTSDVLKSIESYIFEQKDVDIVFTTVGGSSGIGMGPPATNTGSIYTRLIPLNERDVSTNELIDDITNYVALIPEADVNVQSLQSAEMGGSPVSIEITGDDLNVLRTLANEVQAIVNNVSGTYNVTHSMEETRPELQVSVNRDLAAQYGLSYQEVMQAIRMSFQGQTATFVRQQSQEIEVNVILPPEYREQLNDLKHLTIHTPTGDNIALSTIADFHHVQGPNVINRQNQQRGVVVSGDIAGRDLGSVISEIDQQLQTFHFPDGYNFSFGGQYEQMNSNFTDLTLALLLAIFLVYAVMAVQFEKVMYPFIVMFSLPATFIGIIFGFVITGRPLSVPAFIGIIMLAGIVVNNAIVLVDYINTLRERGMERFEAIVTAGPHRLRPILMTMLTTVLAMIPLAIGIGEGSEMQVPLATVIVFGLSFSTVITLFLVPVMYILMDDLTNWIKRRFTRQSSTVHVEANEPSSTIER